MGAYCMHWTSSATKNLLGQLQATPPSVSPTSLLFWCALKRRRRQVNCPKKPTPHSTPSTLAAFLTTAGYSPRLRQTSTGAPIDMHEGALHLHTREEAGQNRKTWIGRRRNALRSNISTPHKA